MQIGYIPNYQCQFFCQLNKWTS